MSEAPSLKHAVAIGASLIVVAFASVAAMSAMAKAAGGVPAPVMVFFQSAISFALVSVHQLAETEPASRVLCRHASANRIAAFNYSVVVFSGLIGWVVWKDTPGWV